MIRLFKKHYKAIRKRGLIKEYTNDGDFYAKACEELKEIRTALKETKTQEITDLMMVCANWLNHRGCNIRKEVRKNLKTQQRRAKNMKK